MWLKALLWLLLPSALVKQPIQTQHVTLTELSQTTELERLNPEFTPDWLPPSLRLLSSYE